MFRCWADSLGTHWIQCVWASSREKKRKGTLPTWSGLIQASLWIDQVIQIVRFNTVHQAHTCVATLVESCLDFTIPKLATAWSCIQFPYILATFVPCQPFLAVTEIGHCNDREVIWRVVGNWGSTADLISPIHQFKDWCSSIAQALKMTTWEWCNSSNSLRPSPQFASARGILHTFAKSTPWRHNVPCNLSDLLKNLAPLCSRRRNCRWDEPHGRREAPWAEVAFIGRNGDGNAKDRGTSTWGGAAKSEPSYHCKPLRHLLQACSPSSHHSTTQSGHKARHPSAAAMDIFKNSWSPHFIPA